MRKLVLLAALLGASAIVPAFALTEHNLVSIAGLRDTDAYWHNFRAPVSSVTFLSRDSDVDCGAVTVRYQDGESQAIFRGRLYAGEPQKVIFPTRRIADIHFRCHTDNEGGANLDLTANMVGEASMGQAPIHETSFAAPMASETFGRWDDHSVMISDSPDVRAIALKPQGADAQCRNLTASFNDGSSVNLPVNGGQTMQEGGTYSVPVNGGYRGLNAVGLTCEAANARAVTIDIYGVG
ncbi:MAG TPA: hypothetical protein VN685_06380 [Rhizomicrobium sp.]|jgi:hypothetical protein|nr:hypothetical protein [Rhizomicrobium sp.]